jgi:hypothetical protein
MRKRLAIVVGLLMSAVLLGGCVAIKSASGVQQDLVGKLRVTVVVCKVDGGTTIDHPGCNLTSNAGEGGGGGTSQLLFGLRVPNGTDAPQSVTGTTNDAAPQPLTFTRDANYESQLAELVPPGEGQTWVGYLSGPYTYAAGANGTPAREISIVADLGLPRSGDGAPYVGALPVVPIAGGRLVSDTYPATRQVACASPPYGVSTDNTVCIDSPSLGAIGSAYNFPTRDFGIVAGNATASAGQTVSLPFGVRGAGALPAGLTATLSAATALPGATVAPSQSSVPLSNGSDTRVTVPVTIPRDAPAGVHDVALIGRLDNGQERRGMAQLTVRARPPVPDVTKPVISKLAVKPKAFKPATRKKPKRGADVSYTLSEAASVRVVVERCAKYAKPKAKKRGAAKRRCLRFAAMRGAQTKVGKAGANGFRFNGKVGGKTLKAGPYKLVLTATDPAANVSAATRIAFVVR